jgi:predicted RNA-binding Zn-ribbon protein involved in translation (DUF1610 family)
MSGDNKTLGRFHLVGIPPAPRGIPQIEVSFKIDANGIVNISARDLATDKKQSITITGTGTLSRNEVDNMVGDAEKYSKLDAKKKKEAELRNQADALIYNTEKAIEEVGEKLDSDRLKSTKKALKVTKKALKGKNVTEIRDAVEVLNQESQELFTALYAEAAKRELEEEEEEVEGEEEYKPVSIPCPKCKAKIIVTSPKRPIQIKCPKCGVKGTLKAGKEKPKKPPAKGKEKEKMKAKPGVPEGELKAKKPGKKEEAKKPEKEKEPEEEYKPVSIPCPKCGEKIKVKSPERPITIKCKKCGAKGTLKGKGPKKKAAEKEREEKKEPEGEPKKEKKKEKGKEGKVKEEKKKRKAEKTEEIDEETGEKIIAPPEPSKGEEVFHEPRKGIWQPSDKEFKFGEEEGTEEKPETKKKIKEKDKELKKKKEKIKEKEKRPKEDKKVKPLKIRCKCGGQIIVKTSKRPIKIKCPECGKTGTLKK